MGKLRAVADTAPLVAAANARDGSHQLAAYMVTALGRELIVPDPVLVEADHLLRSRVGPEAARALLTAIAAGEHEVGYMSAGLMRRAVQIDAAYADLDLGFVDASVMAFAERHRLPILTFDFADFRATASADGPWKLVVDESQHREATDGTG